MSSFDFISWVKDYNNWVLLHISVIWLLITVFLYKRVKVQDKGKFSIVIDCYFFSQSLLVGFLLWGCLVGFDYYDMWFNYHLPQDFLEWVVTVFFFLAMNSPVLIIGGVLFCIGYTNLAMIQEDNQLKEFKSLLKNLKEAENVLEDNYARASQIRWLYNEFEYNKNLPFYREELRNRVKRDIEYAKSKQTVSDLDKLLKAKTTLFQLAQSKEQTAEFIEGVHKTIKILEILEKKVKH